MNRTGYLVTGLVYVLGGLPGVFFLVRGSFLGSSNPYLLPSLTGVLPGVLLILYGTGRLAANSRSGIGLRIAFIGAAFSVFMTLSLIGVALGVKPLATSVVFCATAASYLALVSLVFLILAIRSKRREP